MNKKEPRTERYQTGWCTTIKKDRNVTYVLPHENAVIRYQKAIVKQILFHLKLLKEETLPQVFVDRNEALVCGTLGQNC